MPTGSPTVDMIRTRRLCAYALDTSIIEAAGFRLETGTLGQLKSQLPSWLKLLMPEVVAKEVLDHRTAHISKAELQLKGAYAELRKHGGPQFSKVGLSLSEEMVEVAGDFFEEQMLRFVHNLNGEWLPLADALLPELFRRYFDGLPPFGGGRDKKHEFPDAAILLSLEDYAKAHDILIAAVSRDDGWKRYAAQSERLFCLDSLEDLTSRFKSSTPEALQLRRNLVAALKSDTGKLRDRIIHDLGTKASQLIWSLRPLQWPSVREHWFGYRLQLDLLRAQFSSVTVSADGVGLWLTSPNIDHCIAEVYIDATVAIEMQAYWWDSMLDSAANEPRTACVDKEIQLKAFIDCRGRLTTDPITNWQIDASWATAEVDVEVRYSEFDPSGVSKDEFDDPDIPF